VIAPHRSDRISALDGLSVDCLTRQGSDGIAAANPRLMRAEVKHEVRSAILVHIPDVPFALRCHCAVGAESNAQRRDGGRVEAGSR
jgi:hypothetical protein